MFNYKIIFIKNDKEITFKENDIVSLELIEKEETLPSAKIQVPYNNLSKISDCSICKIFIDNTLFFYGNVSSFKSKYNEYIEVEIEAKNTCSNIADNEGGILTKIKEDHPNLFKTSKITEISKTGTIETVDLLNPTESLDVTKKIISGTLFIEKNNKLSINEIDLELEASWLSRRTGDINISSKLEKYFKRSRINTLTPSKLTNAWPEFGDKLSSSIRGSRYFISMSKLREKETIPIKKIKIGETNIDLKNHIFEGKLMISWDYDQYMRETIKISLKNNDISFGSRMPLKINLKNVQDYIDNYEIQTFFGTNIGCNIANEIFKSICNSMILSLRNIEVTAELFPDESTLNLSTKTWIKIQDKLYKITEIHRHITANKHTLKIKAVAFCNDISAYNTFKSYAINVSEPKEITDTDIIQDIIVKNDGDTQYDNLIKYIANLNNSEKINSQNCRQLISNFLNDNQTEIQIVMKPLKTTYCEHKAINLNTISITGEQL
ncbi:MAG: hypothetical protein IJ481_03750 [Alphaproteobacteria bacterium]|nr:hypothetical protein [Alphaproteobacteria bacterium]